MQVVKSVTVTEARLELSFRGRPQLVLVVDALPVPGTDGFPAIPTSIGIAGRGGEAISMARAGLPAMLVCSVELDPLAVLDRDDEEQETGMLAWVTVARARKEVARHLPGVEIVKAAEGWAPVCTTASPARIAVVDADERRRAGIARELSGPGGYLAVEIASPLALARLVPCADLIVGPPQSCSGLRVPLSSSAEEVIPVIEVAPLTEVDGRKLRNRIAVALALSTQHRLDSGDARAGKIRRWLACARDLRALRNL